MTSFGTASDVEDDCAVESRLRLELDQRVDVPQIGGLFQFEGRCGSNSDDADFWQVLAVGAAYVLCLDDWDDAALEVDLWRSAIAALKARRYRDWAHLELEDAEAAIVGEVNLFIQRVFKEENPVVATKRAKPETKTEHSETDEEFEKLKSTGKSRAKPPSVSTGDLLAGIEVIEERDVEYSKIRRSAANPRTTFDEELISEMAPTIETICRLNPLTIREGTNELIDGETRHRAGQVGKAKSLRCKIVRCTDAQAACIRILTSLQRRDLNAIDRAMGIKALQEQHGLSQRQLEDILKMKQGSMSNLTRLLELPDEWRARVISGEITPTAARELCPWVTEPEVMKAVTSDLNRIAFDEGNLALSGLIVNAISACSRPLKDPHYYDRSTKQFRSRAVDLKPTDEQREALRIRKVKIYRELEERCFNIELWNTLQNADEQRRASKELKKLDAEASKNGKAVDPKKAAENAKRQKEIFAKKLYQYRVRWYQQQLIYSVEKADPSTISKYLMIFGTLGGCSQRESDLTAIVRPGYKGYSYDEGRQEKTVAILLAMTPDEVTKALRSTLEFWFDHKFEGYHPTIEPALIEQLAAGADIDVKRDWPKSCEANDGDTLDDFLAILNREQLVELMGEWIMPPAPASAKRSEIVTLIADSFTAKSHKTPKILIEAKEVRLV